MDEINLDLVGLGKVTGKRFDSAKGYYNQMYLDEENNRFIKLTKIDFEENLSKKLLRELVYYHKFLRDVGVMVPENYYLGINEGTHILEIDEYIPMTFSAAIEKYGVEKTTESLFNDVFFPLFKSNKTKYLECGIDTPLRNFQFKDERAYYIDFFLPRVFFGVDDTMLEVPELTDPKDRIVGIFNKFEPQGVLYSLFINLCREFPKYRQFFKEICIKLSKDLNRPELAKYIELSKVEEIFGKEKEHQKKFIEELSFEKEEYFFARDLACYLAINNEEFALVLEDFFKATSNAAGNSMYIGDRISDAKQMLIKHL